MKIALFTETFLPSTDGIVTRLLATIDHLLESDHELAIVAPYGGDSQYKGIPILPIRGFPYPFYPQLKFCFPTSSMGAFLQDFQPDLVHVVNPVVLGLGGIYYARKMHLPLVASFHTHLAKYAHTYHVPFLDPVAWHYLRIIHNLASVNLATSKTMVHELVSRGYHNVRWWEGGVDTQRFHPQYRDDNMRNYLTDGHPDHFILLYVGRLAHEKDLDQIRPLLNLIPNLSIAFVGDGPARDKLEHVFVGTRAKFVGFLHGNELSTAYASADGFIFPSTTETLGLVLLEAMSSGLPIIAADSLPTRELLKGHESGIVYQPGNLQSLVNAIQKLMSQSPLQRQMAINARHIAESRNWLAPTDKLIHYYELAIRMHRIHMMKGQHKPASSKEEFIQI